MIKVKTKRDFLKIIDLYYDFRKNVAQLWNLTLISLLSISSMSLVNVAPNCVMTSTTSLWGWFRLTVNLSLSQLCISNLCWCKTSSGTLLSPLFEFEFLLLIWLFKLALRGLNPGRFNCKWLTLLYSTKNRWTWCDKPWTKLTSLALPLWPNCLEFRKKWVMKSPKILFTFSDIPHRYWFYVGILPKTGIVY